MTCQRSAAFIRSLQGGPSRHIRLKVKEAIKVLSFPLKTFRSSLLSPQLPILARQVNLAKWKLKFKYNVITNNHLVPGALPECESVLLFQEEYSGICQKRCLLLKTLRFSAVCFLCISAKVSVSAGGVGGWPGCGTPWVLWRALGSVWVCSGITEFRTGNHLGSSPCWMVAAEGIFQQGQTSSPSCYCAPRMLRNDVTGAHGTVC